MLDKKYFLAGIFTLLSVSLAISAQPVHPTTGEPLVIDCLRGTPDAIDGDLSDWNLEAMTPAVLDAAEQLYSGQDSWTGPEDCSGEVYLLWDDVKIYIAAVVKDEKLSMNKTDGSIWNADCVEVFFATTDARADHSWSNPTIHYQYGFNANNQKWNWCNMDGPGQSEPDYLQIAASETADGYICEASIEYGQMLSLDFSAGNTIGFHSSIDDTDIENGDTELFMTWTGLAPHDQSLGFGHMVLSAEPVPIVDMEIGFATYPPVIDGEVDGLWAAASTQYFVPVGDLADASGSWQALYDSENLYVIADISDESLMNDSGAAYLDDSVEFYFDGGNTKDGPPLSGNNRQYTFGWTAEDIQGVNQIIEGVEHAQVDTDTGWRIEIKLPWLSLQDTLPQASDLIGIDCFYNDDDDGGDSREDQIWTFATDGSAWNDASQWGTAMLAADKRVDVTTLGDAIQGVPNDGDWPGAETPDLAIDDNVETKYLHFKGDFDPDPGTGGAGFQVTPAAGSTIVTGLTLTTANDVPGRDPIAFELSGSNEGIDGQYELIASGDIVDFAGEAEWPRFTMNATPISFKNDKAYAHYQLIFTAIRGPVGGSVNSMQIAEVELLGIPGPAGLVGHWKLDEGTGTTALDASGNGNNGTLLDGPTVVDGKFGQALAFEGNRVAIPASDTLTADLFQGSFTLSAWINPKRTGGTWQQIFRSMIADDTSNDTLFINNDGRLSWRGRIGGAWAGGMCETAPDVVPADQWTHIAVTGDGTNFRIYVNGALSQESAFQTTDGANATYYLGGDPTWIGESYSGMIDDVRIYNVALSPEEIEALAQ